MNRTVRNCPAFAFQCPREWDKLTATENADVRHCDACREKVYFVRTDEETIERARAGQCIAREVPDGSELPPIYVGRPEGIPAPSPKQLAADLVFRRERGIDRALEDIKISRRDCPKCRYPVASWHKRCTVCGHEVGRV